MSFIVYILRTTQNKLYIGQTKNLKERLERHKSGDGARFIKDNDSNFELVYTEDFDTQLFAMRREKQLKRLDKSKKRSLDS